jgi:hypothetical protein
MSWGKIDGVVGAALGTGLLVLGITSRNAAPLARGILMVGGALGMVDGAAQVASSGVDPSAVKLAQLEQQVKQLQAEHRQDTFQVDEAHCADVSPR